MATVPEASGCLSFWLHDDSYLVCGDRVHIILQWGWANAQSSSPQMLMALLRTSGLGTSSLQTGKGPQVRTTPFPVPSHACTFPQQLRIWGSTKIATEFMFSPQSFLLGSLLCFLRKKFCTAEHMQTALPAQSSPLRWAPFKCLALSYVSEAITVSTWAQREQCQRRALGGPRRRALTSLLL